MNRRRLKGMNLLQSKEFEKSPEGLKPLLSGNTSMFRKDRESTLQPRKRKRMNSLNMGASTSNLEGTSKSGASEEGKIEQKIGFVSGLTLYQNSQQANRHDESIPKSTQLSQYRSPSRKKSKPLKKNTKSPQKNTLR